MKNILYKLNIVLDVIESGLLLLMINDNTLFCSKSQDLIIIYKITKRCSGCFDGFQGHNTMACFHRTTHWDHQRFEYLIKTS